MVHAWYILSEEQSKDGSKRVSNDGCPTIVQCHHYHWPPSSDSYWSSIRILPPLRYHQQTYILIIAITNQHHVLSTAAQPEPHHAPHTFHVSGQSYHACTSSWGHGSWLPQGLARIWVSILQHPSKYESFCYMFHSTTICSPKYLLICLCLSLINTPVCCMYFSSLNINLAIYFSQLNLICLTLLLGSTPDSPTSSGPPKFKASIKRVAQPTSWSQRLARLRTRYLHPNSELNTDTTWKVMARPKESTKLWSSIYQTLEQYLPNYGAVSPHVFQLSTQ